MKKITLLCLFILGLTACSSNTLDQRVTRVGKEGDISITDLRSFVSPTNNLLTAQGIFHNRGKKIQTGFYRCQFYDTNGMRAGDSQVWQPITIYPNADDAVRCVATQLEAVDFKIEFSTDGKNVSILK
jgi:uncharacterized protein YcfL